MKKKIFNRLITATALMGIIVASAPMIASSSDPNSGPQTIKLVGTLRDFKAGYDGSGKPLQGGHPDFERTPGKKGKVHGSKTKLGKDFSYGLDYNIVKSDIGSGGKPKFNGVTKSTTTEEYFDQWYKDVDGVNKSIPYEIVLTETSPGTYTYHNSSFFPLDNHPDSFGNQGRSHNYHFTYEIHTEFTYQPGQQFTFIGDDDVWVFIGGKRVIDLGGVHSQKTQSVDLDTLGLTAGKTYDFDLFFAERHTTASNFKIETSIPFNPTSTSTPFEAD